MLLKDQTWSCLFITLILFSTWLYYLLGFFRKDSSKVVLAIYFLPPGHLLTPCHLSSPTCVLDTGQMFAQGLILPMGDEDSLGLERRQCHMIPRVALSHAEPRSWPENTVTITHLIPEQPRTLVVLCSFLFGFILSSVKCQCLGLMRSRDFIE